MVGVLGLRFYIADTVFARALQEPIFTDAEKTLQQKISCWEAVWERLDMIFLSSELQNLTIIQRPGRCVFLSL